MEVGATRFAAGEYARAVDAPRLRLRPPADYRAKPPQKRYSVTVLIGKPKPALPLPNIEGPAGAHLPLVVVYPGHVGHAPGADPPHKRSEAGPVGTRVVCSLSTRWAPNFINKKIQKTQKT